MQALTADQYARLARLAETWQRDFLEAARGEPGFNPCLVVDALCFRPWSLGEERHGLLGALITPVSLSLVLLPDDAAGWPVPAAGEGLVLVLGLPSGRYPFRAESLGDGSRLWRCPILDDLSDLASPQQGSRLAQRLMDKVMEGET